MLSAGRGAPCGAPRVPGWAADSGIGQPLQRDVCAAGRVRRAAPADCYEHTRRLLCVNAPLTASLVRTDARGGGGGWMLKHHLCNVTSLQPCARRPAQARPHPFTGATHTSAPPSSLCGLRPLAPTLPRALAAGGPP